jgi:hypothetical protein
MNVRTPPTVLAGIGGSLCVAEVISFVELSQRGGPDNVPLFALGFAVLFALGAWLLRTGRTRTGAILVGLLATFEVVDYPSWAKDGAFDWIFDTTIAVVALAGMFTTIAVLVTRRPGARGRVLSGQAVQQ